MSESGSANSQWSQEPQPLEHLIFEAHLTPQPAADLERAAPDLVLMPHEVVADESSNGFARALNVVRRGTETGALVYEFSPLNEILRYGAGLAIYAKTGDPELAAGGLAAFTAFTEGATAIAAADLLNSPVARAIIDRINRFAAKRGIPEDAEAGIVAKSAITYLGGAALVTAVKHREDPTRTVRQNIAYGTRAAALVSIPAAVPLWLTLRGIDAPDFDTIAGAAFGVASVPVLYKLAKHSISRRRAGSSDELDEIMTDIKQLEAGDE